MSRLFGKAKKAPSTADQIGKMRETLANMDQREALLNKKIQDSLIQAKEMMAKKNKNGIACTSPALFPHFPIHFSITCFPLSFFTVITTDIYLQLY